MISSDEQNTFIIKSLISVSGSIKDPSYTGIISGLNKIDARLLPFINENIDEIVDEFYTAKINLAIEIGVKIPAERKVVIQTIANIASANSQLKDLQLLTIINQELSKINISYRLPVSLAGNLKSISERCLGIIGGINSLKLLGKQLLVEEVAAHINKYMTKQAGSLKPLINLLGDALIKMADHASEPEIMQKAATDALLKIGYLKVGVEGKDPGQLANTIFYEMVAAQGVLNAKEKKGQEEVTKDEVLDQVAIVLVNSLK